MDYIGVIRHFITPIVAEIDKVEINELPSNSRKAHTFLIRCTEEDIGRLIGHKGTTANALREVVSIAAKNNNEFVHLKIASLNDPIENFLSKDDQVEPNEETNSEEDC